MQNTKPLQFQASAGSYFLLSIISIILAYIPIFGWAYLLNYTSEWFASKSQVNGRAITYHAGYGESLKFVFVNMLLIIITLGIYSFWFYPKAYRYIADHVSYSDETAAAPAAATPTVQALQDPTQSPVA